MKDSLNYKASDHAAVRTQEYLYNQLFPYIGNKRKLLPLIWEAIVKCHSEGAGRLKSLITKSDSSLEPALSVANVDQNDSVTFAYLFSGSGVVSRLAKKN